MESQRNEDKKETQMQTKNKNQKKNKNKEKKRLMSLLRAPEVVHKLYRKTTEEESKEIKQLIIDIMDKNSALKLHQKKRKTPEEKNETKRSDFKITNELVLGLNSIIRCIEKKSIIGVILTNPLALPLEDNVIELCSDNLIPCLSVQSFDEMKSYLNISSLTAIAFKPIVVSNDSTFHELYEKFVNILNINCFSIESNDGKQEPEVIEEKSIKVDSRVKPDKSESIDKSHPLFETLYSKKSEDNYRYLVDKVIKNSSDSSQRKDEFLTQESMIKFSSKPELYFPETKDLSKGFSKIEIFLDEQQIDSNDDSFALSLIDSMDESECRPSKGSKRKFSHQNERQSPHFRSPRVVRLEPSDQKIKNRKQRKQMKKQNRSKT